jgi:hypothetical protein
MSVMLFSCTKKILKSTATKNMHNHNYYSKSAAENTTRKRHPPLEIEFN